MSMRMRRADFMTRPPLSVWGECAALPALGRRDTGDPGTADAGLDGNGTFEPKATTGIVTAVPEGEVRARSRRR